MAYKNNFLVGGTASDDGYYGSNTAAKAVDGSNSTYFESNSGLPCYWQYDLGASVTKAATKLAILVVTYATEGPKSFTLKASNTGAFGGEEATLLTVTNDPNWSANEVREWTFANTTAYRYYRITISSTQQGSFALMGEIRLYETDDDEVEYSADILTGGTASAESDNDNAGKACDGNLATRWTGGAVPEWWQYDLGAGVAKTVVKLTMQADSSISYCQGVKSFSLLASNTGNFSGEEATLLEVANELGWIPSEYRSWTFENATAYRYYRLSVTAIQDTWAYVSELEMMEGEDPAAAPYDDGTPSGGFVFGGEVVEVGVSSYTDPAASGGIVFGGEETSADENHQVDGTSSGGIVFGGAVAEQWQAEPNNSVAVKGGTYRIAGTLYTLAETLSYPGLGSCASLVNCGAAPAVAGQYRYDLLSIDAAGTITVTAGTAATTPVMPSLPSNEVKLDHVLRYYGQTSIVQGDIGKMYATPQLTTLTAVVTDDELAWAEASTAITVTCRDQYGQLYTGGKVVNAAITTGNGTISPASRSGSASSFTFTYTRDQELTDESPVITFSSPTGPFCTIFVRLLDSDGNLMT
jgi:hypothetical protein